MIEYIERPTIKGKIIEFDFSTNEELKNIVGDKNAKIEKNQNEINRFKEDITKYPIVFLDGVQLEATEVKFLKIYNDTFLPRIKLSFVDVTNKILDENYPLDNSIISFFKDSNDEELLPIRMEFKITNFTIIKGKSRESGFSCQIDGILNIDDFYVQNFESYKGNSSDVLLELSKNMGLGYATNIKSSTNDEMIWINPANYRIEFMKNIIERSYLDDNTFLFGYVDFYYNFTYVDIEQQINDDISNQMCNIIDKRLTKDVDKVPLILSNHPDIESTNLYINKFTIDNSSFRTNLKCGYQHVITYYDKLKNDIQRYNIETITYDDENDIVLKDSDENLLYDRLITGTYTGKIDTDNVHENFNHTYIQNKINLEFLQKLKMKIKLRKPNYSLYRFQKVLVELYNLNKLTTENNMGDGKMYDDRIINTLSGEWLITGINVNYKLNGGNEQEITLVKRELTLKYDFPRRKN